MCTYVNIKTIVFSLFSLAAVTYSFSDLKTAFCFFRHNILFYVFFLLILLVFYGFVLGREKVRRYSLLSVGIGVFAGVINVLGRNFMLFDSLIFFHKARIFAYVFSLIAAVGYGLFYATLFEWGWKALKSEEKKISQTKTVNQINTFLFEKRPFLHPFLFICVCWLPYLIAFFPGILQWDSMHALTQYYGYRVWTTHYPPVGVLLMGYAMDFGKFLGNDNYGCTIYIISQFFLFSLTLAYLFIFFKKWDTNYYIRWTALFLFSFCPWFPMYAVNEIKDTLYYISVLWLMYTFLMCFEKDVCSIKLLICAAFAAMCVCLFRKEGIIICCACILSLLAFRRNIFRQWLQMTMSVILAAVLAVLIQNEVVNYNRIKPGSIREALSLPVQQTARYIRDHRKDITLSEWKLLYEVFNNRAKILGDVYEPNRSDAVKIKMKYAPSQKQIKAYIEVWRKHFFKHPSSYFSAAFNQIYGYFYIEKPEFYGFGFASYNIKEGHVLYNKHIIVTDCPYTMQLRLFLIKYFSLWKETPFFDLLLHPATYTWLLFFALTCVFRLKKYKYLYLYCIPFTTLLVCCLSPLNASIRYSFPVVLSSLVLLPFSIKISNEKIVPKIID